MYGESSSSQRCDSRYEKSNRLVRSSHDDEFAHFENKKCIPSFEIISALRVIKCASRDATTTEKEVLGKMVCQERTSDTTNYIESNSAAYNFMDSIKII